MIGVVVNFDIAVAIVLRTRGTQGSRKKDFFKDKVVIIDRKECDYYIGRTEWSSPEVDPEVLIPATVKLRVGSFYNVRITDSEEFDLYGEIE